MKNGILKRTLAWMLTFAMVSSMIPGTAFAEEASQAADCTHSHDENCGYVAAVEEVPCDQQCTDTDGDGLIDHAEECAYTPAVEGQPCNHVHDESCGVIVEPSEKNTEAVVPTEESSDGEERLRELIALLGALPDPMACLAQGSLLDRDQLARARTEADSWLAGEEAASSGSAEEREELQSLMVRLEGLEHIRDTETDCLDVDCPYHYPDIIREQMAENETPKLLTLDDLVEDYGVEPPRQTFGRLRSASVPYPQTLMLTADNENNSHTGSSDGDIDEIMSKSDGNHPIEMSFTLTEVPTQSAYLAVKAYDVDEDGGETDYVYINDDIFLTKDKTNSYNEVYHDSTIGYLSGTNNTWNTTILRIPLEKLKVGKNTISVTIASGWVVEVDWMQLVLDGGAVDSNIEEFSLKLENSAASGNNVTVQSSVTVRQTGNVQYTTEYTLTQNATGNSLDACFGTVSASETIELSMPLSSPSGIYTITGILKESETEAIKATDSISFYFTQDVGLGPKISHTLTPDGLTNQDVTITISAEGVPETGITDIRIPESPKTVSENGSYPFTVNYTLNGNSQSVTYPVKVDTIDKQAPVIMYLPISVFQDEEYETVKTLFADDLSVTDDRELAGEPLSYTIPQDISNTSGAKTITVTATDAAGNTATQDCTITVLAKPVKLIMGTPAPVSGSKNSYTLTAVLDNGSDTITETGFVWGVMPNPTLELNNGSVQTAPVVQAKGGTLTGTATGLLSGVEYYARAYAKVTENGTTTVVYSDAEKFGFGIPTYGTFSVSSVSGSTFTITRTGGTDGAQTVYYRTVNGSAIGGTHFTHQAGTLTFADGETSQTVTVTELDVTRAYNSDEGTQYSNADRTYSLEIYRVEGGGAIDQNNRAKTRTMAKSGSYTVDRSIYTTEKSKTQVAAVTGTSGKKVADTTSDQGGKDYTNVRFLTNRDGNTNYNTSSSFSTYYTDTYQAAYLNATATGWYYRYVLRAYEQEDGYEHAYIGTSPLEDEQYTTGGKGYPVSGLTGQLWACTFLQGQKDAVGTYSFPDTRTEGGENSYYPLNSSGSYVSYNNQTYVSLGLANTAYCYFGANGQNEDIWYVDGLTSYALVKDDREPALLGVAPMAGGTYLPGDPITVALVFDEIVDGTNSTLSSVSINTNVGTLHYAGGADTNVLYFTGTVASAANLNGNDALQVTAINNSSSIKDMCSTAGTASTATSGNTNVTVDATKPTVTITANTSGSLPQHKATITATDAKTLQYAWTQGTTLPAYGWSNVTSGTQLTESRGAAGATETWYLHVLATSSSGATTHTYHSFSFMQPNITAVSVRAGASSTSADVADVWKPSKYIVVTYEGAQTSETTLTFAGPQTSSQNITSASGTKYLQVTKNGTYTVTLKDSYGSVISKTIEVKKIDADQPTVTLRSGNSTESETVYNSLNIAVLPKDAGGSGLAKVEYAWTNTATEPTSWSQLTAAPDGSYEAVYTATETTKAAKYLHVKATDGAGNVSSVVTSGPYQVIQAATGSALPSITVTGNPAAWTNSAALTWTATKGTGTGAGALQTVYTPDGVITGSTTGTCTVTKNGVYSFVVIDANGNSASEEVLVTNVDSEAPKLTSLTAQAGHTSGTITLAGVTDNCTVIYDSKGNYSGISGSGLQSRQYKLEGANTWTTFTADSITVTKNGTYIIQLTDQVGNSREYSVNMEGIDATAPEVTCTINATANASSGWYTTENLPVDLNFAEEAGAEGGTPSGIQSVQYKWVTSNTTNPTSGLTSASATAIGNGTVTTELSDQGTWYLYYKVTDNKGNVTEGFSDVIKKDTFSASSVITGPTAGQPISSGLAMQCQVTYGPSGGRIMGGPAAASATLLDTFDQSTGTASRTKTVNYTAKTTGTNDFRFYPYASHGAEGTASPNSWPFYVRQITFNSQGGSAMESQLVWYKSETSTELVCAVTKPSDPTRNGYTFGGWYTDEACTDSKQFDFANTQVKANITLYAKWTPAAGTSYKVNHYTEDLTGGTWTLQGTDSKTGTTGAALTLSDLAKSITGFAYKEGQAGGSVVTSTTILADGSRVIDLYYTRNTYTLTLNKGTGISDVSGGGSYKYGQSVSVNATVSAGYTWKDWTGDRTSTDQAFSFTMPASNVALTANATINQYTVTFDANGHGTAPGSQTVNYGGKAVQPAALTATGYVFGGWYKEAGCINKWDFSTGTVTSSITLYAKWTLAKPPVTLTAVGGTTDANSGVVNAVYNNGATVLTLKAELSDPVPGIQYTYAWYKDGVQLDSTEESLTLTTVNESGTYKVEVTASGAGQTATKASGTITVNIAKATPVVTGKPTASAITYGDSLAQSTFTGGEAKAAGTPVAGSFAWATPDTTPAVSDSNATQYAVVFTPGDTANYNSITTACTLTVHKKALTPSVASVADKIYDQTVAASGTVSLAEAVLDQQPEATGTFAFTDANAGQNKQVTVTDITLTGNWGDNYTLTTTSLTNQDTTAKITPKTVGLSWNGDTGLVYSGNSVNVTATATGVLEGDVCEVTVTGGTETNAGTHTATPSLSNTNYCLPEGAAHSYTIEKAPITFDVSNNTATYDGTGKSATVEQTAGQPPRIDAEGYQVSYEKNGVAAATATDAGTYTVIVTLTDGNYQHAEQGDSDHKTVGDLTVDPKPITAVWTNLTAVYNGTAQAPECSNLVGLMDADAEDVFADLEEQRLTDAGTKRLTASLAGTRAFNYRLTNPDVNFTVQKAPVTFAVENNTVQADGAAHKATVSASANGAAWDASNYTITYRNAAGQIVEEPTEAGTYGIYAELNNPNYRHSGTADGTALQIGVLTIYRNQTQTSKTYTVEYAKGASEVTGDLPASQTGVSQGTLIYMPEKGALARTGYAFTGWLLNGKLYQPGETFSMPAKNVTITACWKEATYHISGLVDRNGNPLPHAVVTLKRGSEIIDETTTNEYGKYSFAGVLPGLYNLVTSYDGITTTVKVLIEDTDAEANATLPAGRTNSILEVVAGAPAVIVGNLEKLFQTDGDAPVYTQDDQNVVNGGGTVEIRLTVNQVAEPEDPTGAELLNEALQKLPAAFNYQPELYLDLVLQKTVYQVGSNTPDTTKLTDSQVVLESVIALPSNLQGRNFYKVYRIHQNELNDIEVQELTTRPNAAGEYYKLNPEKTELTIYARKYSVYTVAASDYVAPQPAKPESAGGAESQPDIGSLEEETKAENSQVNQQPLQAAQQLPVKRDPEAEKTQEPPEEIPTETPEEIPTETPEEIPTEIPEAPLPEQEQWEEPLPAERNGKSFVVLNVLLTLLSLVMAVRLLRGRQVRRRKMAGLTAAAASLLLLLLTLGFARVRMVDLCTIPFALLAAITVFMSLTGSKQDQEERVL